MEDKIPKEALWNILIKSEIITNELLTPSNIKEYQKVLNKEPPNGGWYIDSCLRYMLWELRQNKED